jgi:VWFA-related protein
LKWVKPSCVLKYYNVEVLGTWKPVRRLLALALGLLIVSVTLVPAAAVKLQRLDLSRLPEIECYFTVSTDRGDSLLGLAAADFSVQVDGVPQKISRLASALNDGKSLAVALLVDGSGSMRPHMRKACEAAAAFISHTSSSDRVAVFSCSESLLLHQDFTIDHALTLQALSEIRTRKNTAIFDAIKEIIALYKNVPAHRQALVILTDGQDNRSRATVAENIQLAKDAGVSLFTVGLGPGSDDLSLRRLAEETGGEFFKAARAEDLLALYRKIAEHLNNQYILAFASTFAGDEQWHDLQIAYADPNGTRPTVQREFRASTSPALTPSAIVSVQTSTRRHEQRRQAFIGALLGLLSGILLLGVLKLLRPSAILFSLLGLAMLLALTMLGAVLAVLRYMLT